MSLILNIETATTVCSVSLGLNGKTIALRELNAGYTHAENLHLFIREILAESGKAMNELAAVCVSKGPGSYTGLRIGTSAAKGIAFALNIPLLSLDTLLVMSAMAAEKQPGPAFYCPLIDARRMEVYTALYDESLNILRNTEALVVDANSVNQYAGKTPTFFFGDGMPKCRSLFSENENAGFIEDIVPSAVYMSFLSQKKFENKHFEDLAAFEPFYLKDFIAGKPKKQI